MSKLNASESAAFHRNSTLDGRPLGPAERERYLEKYLPHKDSSSSREPSPARRQKSHVKPTMPATKTGKKQRRKPIRTFAGSQLHIFIYNLIHLIFGIYVRLRTTYRAICGRILGVLYYHHRTPELIQKDIKALDKLPEHLSLILQFREDEGLEGLVNDVAEITAWCASAQIPMVSIYEKSGILKSYLPQTHRAISRNLHAYFGSSQKPTVSLRAPQMPSYSPPTTPLSPFPESEPFHIDVLIISESDGRETIVDLTKTLSEMSQHGKLTSKEVTSEVIDAELIEGVMDEPDLLILFGGSVKLDGYPPWQVRLTEIFHVPDNTEGVSYQIFLQALHRYAKAQMRFGR